MIHTVGPADITRPHQSPSAATQYLGSRADIQSMRALAVGLVVAAHANLPWLPGGYVGVDVFFVLSGYLISGLILRELQLTGSFDPWRFYARRQKRLLPAMLLVIISTAIAAWAILSPLQQTGETAAGQAATIWLSNFYFATRAIDYFSSGMYGNLFLHTWSLAVEEQFYLIWPWLLLFFFGAWQWQGKPFSYRRLISCLLLVTATSLATAIYCAEFHVEDGFYLMPARAWEFALGSLTYLLRNACQLGHFRRLDSLRGRSILAATGWICILTAAVLYSDNLRYPGAWALLPCLGATLILLDAPEKNPSAFFSRWILHQPLLLFIGDISYSLYLWHWPVLKVGTQVFGSEPIPRLALVITCLILASITYIAIERPIHRAPLRNKAGVLIGSVLAMMASFFAMSLWQNAAVDLLNKPEQAHLRTTRFDIPDIYSRGCDTWLHSAKVIPCTKGSATATRTVVMFGDSTLAQWYPAIEEIFRHRPGWRLVILTKSACPASQISYYYARIKASFEICDRWRQQAIEHIVQMRPDIVMMGSQNYDFSSAQWIAGTNLVLERLSPVAKSVVVLSPTPNLGFDGLNCLSMALNVPEWISQNARCATKIHLLKPTILEILREATRPYPNVHAIDLSETVCPNATCRARDERGIIFRDNQHLTASFVRTSAPELERALRHAGALR